MQPLEGGYSGETFVADSAGERTVVRIYAQRGRARGPRAVDIDAAVLRLVRGLLPVPEVLEVVRPDGATDAPGLLVTSFLPGKRLDLVLPRLDAGGRRAAGAAAGEVLARLACMPMPSRGFFVDPALQVAPIGVVDLAQWVGRHREGTALEAWDEGLFARLLSVADEAQVLLDTVRRTCLVHSDLNPKNLLVDPTSLAVTGVLDWEFAHAGYPVTDLGNLLRFDRDPQWSAEWSDAVLATYADLVPDAPANLLELARAADLYALVDLAARRGTNPVSDRAHDLLETVARSGSL